MNASAKASGAVLSAEGISVHYDGVRAVDNVHLALEEGQIMGLIGPNGAGKSTFMGALSRFISLTAGRVLLGGRELNRVPPHRLPGLGIVRTFQDATTFASLSVSENVQLGALGAGLSRRAARARAAELLDTLGLRDVAEDPAGTLPTGDERRLGIARAVAGSPRFLLLDEPGAGLDDTESRSLAVAIGDIRAQSGCGVLLVEHDLRVIFGVCDHIHVLDFGRTIASGTPDEIRADPTVIAAYLGHQGAEIAKEQLHAASD